MTTKFLRLHLMLILMFAAGYAMSQDTLVTKKGEKKLVKVVEVGEYEIKYKEFEDLEGPMFVMNKDKIQIIRFQSGRKMTFEKDEMDVNKEQEILDKRSAYKIQPFGFVGNHITFGYERVIKVGMNFEGKLGIIYGAPVVNSYEQNRKDKGFFIKPGIKFLLGSDYYVKGMKYAHPLKGRYIKIEPLWCSATYYNMWVRKKEYQTDPFGNTYLTDVTVQKDLAVNSIAGHLIYGRQFTMGNVMTLDYYIGLGVNKTYVKAKDGSDIEDQYLSVGLLHSHVAGMRGLSFTWGLSIGIIGK